MLLVIFGAGASFDAVPSHRPPVRLKERLPLANELFDLRPAFVHGLAQLPECHEVIPRLRKHGVAIEQELERMRDEARTYPRRHKQLAAIRFYLHSVISQCCHEWSATSRGVTNYKALIDDFERLCPTGPILLVTFNYDTMLDENLQEMGLGLSFTHITKYIEHHRYKLFKVHGSTNWGRRVRLELPPTGDPWPVARFLTLQRGSVDSR